MKVFVEIAEATVRLEEWIDLATHGNEVLICRDGNPIAGLAAMGKTMDTWDERSSLMPQGRKSVSVGATSSHDGFYNEHGLPE